MPCRPRSQRAAKRQRSRFALIFRAKPDPPPENAAEAQRGPFEGGSKACGCVQELADYGCVISRRSRRPGRGRWTHESRTATACSSEASKPREPEKPYSAAAVRRANSSTASLWPGTWRISSEPGLPAISFSTAASGDTPSRLGSRPAPCLSFPCRPHKTPPPAHPFSQHFA
jgi:hypothetical protein